MMHNLNERVKEYGRRHRFWNRWEKLLAALACVVVFCTTYALILPAITLDQSTTCGLEEHTHTAEVCYAKELICTDESAGHTHTDPCYVSVLTCTQQVHEHTDDCYEQKQDGGKSSTEAGNTASAQTKANTGSAADTANTGDKTGTANGANGANASNGANGANSTNSADTANIADGTNTADGANAAKAGGTADASADAAKTADTTGTSTDTAKNAGTANASADAAKAADAAANPSGDGADGQADGTAAAPANDEDASAETYTAVIVYYDSLQTGVERTGTADLSYGVIADNLPEVTGYTYYGAYLTTNTTDYTGSPVAYVTVQDGTIYYAVDAEAKAVSPLQENERIALHYVRSDNLVKINLTESGETGAAGNAVTGLPATYTRNSSFDFQVSAARGYTATVRVNGKTTTVGSGETATITAATSTTDLDVSVIYTKKTSVTFDPNVFQDRTYRYLYDNGTARFTATNNNDQTAALNQDTGASFTYTFTTVATSTTWQVDSLKINGVYLAIPARTRGASETTVIVPSQNGEPAMTATLTVTGISSGYNATAYTYQLTINGAYEDVVIDDANLNNVSWAEVIPSATEGVTFKNNNDSSVGLNQPSQTAQGGTPSYTFGLENGYENLKFWLYAYNSSGSEITLSSGISNNVITQPTVAGQSTTVTYRYRSGYYGTQTYNDATITKNTDGTYTIRFSSYDSSTGITLQLLKVSAEKKSYSVVYDVNGGTGTITDDNVYDVTDNNIVVITDEEPTPPEGKYFYGWKIQGGDDTLYFTGDSIDIASDEIQAILNAQADTKTLTLAANYVTSLDNGKAIQVPVKVYLNGEEDPEWGYTVEGIVGKKLALTNIPETIEKDGVTYRLVESNSPIDSIQLGDVFELKYVSTVDMTLAKVDADQNPLTGAEFYLYYEDAEGTAWYYNSATGWTADFHAKSIISPSGEGAAAAVNGLQLNTTYYLVENKAPEGYEQLTDAITITPTMSGGAISLKVGGKGASAKDNTVTVVNESGARLPETGGAGTTGYTMSGLVLIAIAMAGCLMYSGMKRRKGGA